VQGGKQPRVDGHAGRDAIALAERVLNSVKAHAWEGSPAGPRGADGLPAPAGPLFDVIERKGDQRAA
jgi:hypothetical protein